VGYVDGNLPTNLGAGKNQDIVLVLKSKEIYLCESQDSYAGAAGNPVRNAYYRNPVVELRGLDHRQAKSMAFISGSALTSPIFT
jgi:hypothetical protein